MSSRLNKTAINNLEVISELGDNIEEYQLIIDGNNISQSNDENYDGLFTLQELEYPVFFTFHQLFNSLRYSNLYKIEDYKTSELISLMNESIDKLVDILDKTEDDPNNQRLSNIIDDIDEKYLELKQRNDTCSFWKIYETFNDYLDTFSEMLLESRRYLYITNIPNSTFTTIREKINKETGEENPNLIYDDTDNDSDNDSDNDKKQN